MPLWIRGTVQLYYIPCQPVQLYNMPCQQVQLYNFMWARLALQYAVPACPALQYAMPVSHSSFTICYASQFSLQYTMPVSPALQYVMLARPAYNMPCLTDLSIFAIRHSSHSSFTICHTPSSPALQCHTPVDQRPSPALQYVIGRGPDLVRLRVELLWGHCVVLVINYVQTNSQLMGQSSQRGHRGPDPPPPRITHYKMWQIVKTGLVTTQGNVQLGLKAY